MEKDRGKKIKQNQQRVLKQRMQLSLYLKPPFVLNSLHSYKFLILKLCLLMIHFPFRFQNLIFNFVFKLASGKRQKIQLQFRIGFQFAYYFKQKIAMNRTKRKALRSYPTQQSGLYTPATIKSPPSTKPEENPGLFIDTAKYSMLKLVQCARLMKIFKESVSRFKGTNQPVSYKQQYDFAEKWQETSKVKHERNYNLLLSANSICLTIAILVMIHKIPLIWYLSVQQIFEVQDYQMWFITGILIIIADLGLKIYLLSSQTSKSVDQIRSTKRQTFFQVVQLVFGDLITIVVLVIKASNPQHSTSEICFDYIAVFFQSHRFYEIYNSITIILITYKYKNYVNLIGFVSKMFVIIHFFAIFIYTITFLNESQNWLIAINMNHEAPIIKYVYSLYFIATTMFTVGYGDTLPKNIIEICVIILIQMTGIILNGYIVSQIGHTLTTIRQNQEEFEHDIQNTDQICQYYQLNEDLKHRVRNYIVNNQLANEQLNINEENQFLMKLNEELRNQVKHANQLQIIKTSLFFLCNWSKKMQSELSKKLQKFIFSPNERILNKDKLYIVTKGKIDVYIEKKVGSKVYVKKHLKTVQRSNSKQVFSNVYGCVSLFTGKPNRLTAVSKDFVICYALDFAEIIDILKDDEKDFEYFHETKTILELERVPQKFQIPTLINNRQHYCPTRWLVLLKHKKSLIGQQERIDHLRSNRRRKKTIVEQKEAEVDESDSECLVSIDEMSVKSKQADTQERQNKQLSKKDSKNNSAFVSFRSYRRKHYFRTLVQDKVKEEEMKRFLTTQIVLTSYFQVGKSYTKYFKKGNRETILSRINKDEIKEFHPINSKIMSMQWLDLIIFTNKINSMEKPKKLAF